MTDKIFCFSEPARQYAENIDLISEIKSSKSSDVKILLSTNNEAVEAVRKEAYQNISEFFKALLEALQRYDWKDLSLRTLQSTSAGRFAGGRIQYLWLEQKKDISTKRRVRERPMINFGIPIIEKINLCNDDVWRDFWGSFDMIKASRMKIWLGTNDENSQIDSNLLRIASKKDFGEYIDYNWGSHNMWLSFNKEDPINSACEKFVQILRELFEIKV